MNGQLNSCSPEELVIRENFKKDYKLSCPVLDDNDIFAKSLNIIGLSTEWKNYWEMAQRVENFNEYRKDLRNQIIGCLLNVPGFSELQVPTSPLKYEGPRTYLRDELLGKRLVSIDLIKGNYQSLQSLGKQFVLGTETYEELVRQFTQEEAMVQSKFFRQMVFGHLKPDVQSAVQRRMLERIIEEVERNVDLTIGHLTNDEVVFVIEGDDDLLKIREAVKKLPYRVRIDEFWIEKIVNSYQDPWYVKHFVNSKNKTRRLMGVHVRYLFQVANFVDGVPNQKKDFWWRERDRLCCLLEPEVLERKGN